MAREILTLIPLVSPVQSVGRVLNLINDRVKVVLRAAHGRVQHDLLIDAIRPVRVFNLIPVSYRFRNVRHAAAQPLDR